jgi:DNA-binding MarR family transcriptional regulator
MTKLNISRKYIDTIPLCLGLMKPYISKVCSVEISFPKYRIIGLIISGSSTVSEIAEFMHVSKPAISKLVDSLTSEKYISRHICPKDRRIIYLRATNKGIKKFEKVRQLASEMFLENLEGLNKKEVNDILNALNVLEDFALKKTGEISC